MLKFPENFNASLIYINDFVPVTNSDINIEVREFVVDFSIVIP